MSFRPARAFKRGPFTHAPAAALAAAAVVVAVAPLTASATSKPAAASVQHAIVQQHAPAVAKKAAAAVPAKPAAAKPAPAKPAAAPPAPAKPAAPAPAVQAAAPVPAKPYAGVSYSELEPHGTQGWQERFTPSADQWSNATTIVQTAHDLNLSPYAATIAVATAIQESTLHNLHYGDRDSLGLFQQRPSMGWGTPSQVTDPTYAAKAFLRQLPSGYQHMNLADAAQTVQRSFDGSLYAKWQTQAAYMVHHIANS